LPRKSDKVRVYSRATEGLSSYRIMPRDGSEPVPFILRLKPQRIARKRNVKENLRPKPASFSMTIGIHGYRRLSDALGKVGMISGHYQVRHLMARLDLKARYPKRFKVTIDSKHDEAISPNSLDRQFEAKAPNQVWTTDITYIWTLEGWPYLAVAVDFFSRQVVGWAIADQ
jgi:Integrase core domain